MKSNETGEQLGVRQGADVQVMTATKSRRSRIARSVDSLAGTAMFVAPLLALVAIWAVVVPLFQINPRVFPSVGAVATAAIESIREQHAIR